VGRNVDREGPNGVIILHRGEIERLRVEQIERKLKTERRLEWIDKRKK
jgi:hypothetical protein